MSRAATSSSPAFFMKSSSPSAVGTEEIQLLGLISMRQLMGHNATDRALIKHLFPRELFVVGHVNRCKGDVWERPPVHGQSPT